MMPAHWRPARRHCWLGSLLLVILVGYPILLLSTTTSPTGLIGTVACVAPITIVAWIATLAYFSWR